MGNILVNYNSGFKGAGIMIFVVKATNKRSEEELHMLHDRLVEELGDVKKADMRYYVYLLIAHALALMTLI